MRTTKKRQSYDASICAIVDICNINLNEDLTLTFENEGGDWKEAANYEFTVFNSDKKNSKNELNSAITTDGSFMDLRLNPDDQNFIDGGIYYYEIYDQDIDRVLIKGNLTIGR